MEINLLLRFLANLIKDEQGILYLGNVAIQFGYMTLISNKRVNFPKPFKRLLAIVPVLSGSSITSEDQPFF